ncbi:MAG: DUF3098 domain-containing protein [Cyclobacteriaceae bacterium]|jgi:hypothetical protein|nr:DUF3098 domain-containing protein [Cyclobacteriaceae bacterium]
MESKLPFTKKNYQVMIIGLLILILGFTIMSIDKADYGFGFMGLTLGPIIVMTGFLIEIFAILYRPKEKK